MNAYRHAQTRAGRLSLEQRREAADLYDQGVTLSDIAGRFGVSIPAIHYHVARRTVLHVARTTEQRAARVGTRTKRGRLSPDDRAAAVQRVGGGESCAAVAADLGVTAAAVAYHVRRAGLANPSAPTGGTRP